MRPLHHTLVATTMYYTVIHGKASLCIEVSLYCNTCRPSFTQHPARKIQKLDGDKPKKQKHSKLTSSALVDSKLGKEPGQHDTALHKVKGDPPDRFWASVEPYCADITHSDIHILQEGIRSVSGEWALIGIVKPCILLCIVL